MEAYAVPAAEADTAVIVPDLSKFETFEQITYTPVSPTAKPAKHVYGVEPDGTLRHLSHDTVLTYFGYGGYMIPEHDYEVRENVAAQIAAVEAQAVAVAAEAVAGLPEQAGPEPDRHRRQWLLRSSIAVASLPARLSAAYRNPETRRRNVALTAGAVALGTLIGFGVYRYGFSVVPPTEHVADPRNLSPHGQWPPQHHVVVPPLRAVSTPPQPPHPPEQAALRLPSYNARTGSGTVWEGVKQYVASLGFDHLKVPDIRRLTQATLRLNHLSWHEARHLPKGYPVRMLSRTALKEFLG